MPAPNRRCLLLWPWLAGLPPAAASPAQETRPPLVLVNTVYPPFVNPPGHRQGEGMDIEIAREALRRGGYSVSVQLVPWKRALVMLEQGLADLTTTISRNDDRDRYLMFSQSYRNGASYHFYARKGTRPLVTSLKDLAARRLGTVAGFHYPPAISDAALAVIDAGRDVNVLVQKLLAGRLDLIVVTGVRGAWEIQESGLGDALEKQPYEYTAESHNYMAFSKRRCSPALVETMRAGLDQMIKEGSLAAIERRYLKGLNG